MNVDIRLMGIYKGQIINLMFLSKEISSVDELHKNNTELQMKVATRVLKYAGFSDKVDEYAMKILKQLKDRDKK